MATRLDNLARRDQLTALSQGALWLLSSAGAVTSVRISRAPLAFTARALVGATLLTAGLKGSVTPQLRWVGRLAAASAALSDLARIASGQRWRVADLALQVGTLFAWSRAAPVARQRPEEPRGQAPAPVEGTPAEDIVTEASMESFPASDPPSYIFRRPRR